MSHAYLSTACLHGEHAYCQGSLRMDGAAKRPACCKFCGAACVCPCHGEIIGASREGVSMNREDKQEQPVPREGFGSPEHAARVGGGRHPGVRDALQWLTFTHLPEKLQRFSEPFYDLAVRLVLEVGTDGPELTTALNRIIEAKDSAVRAGIRHDTGRAGSVPRPQTVVNPPAFAQSSLPPNLTGNYGPGQPRPRQAN